MPKIRRPMVASRRERTLVQLQHWLEHVLKATAFGPGLLERIEAVREQIARNDDGLFRSDEHSYLKACAQCAEILLYCGRTDHARMVLGRGAEVLASLPQGVNPDASVEDRELLRERVRYVNDFIVATHFVAQEYGTAETLLRRCLEFVDGPYPLASPDFPCYGTLGALHLALANVLSGLGRYESATESFTKALQFNTSKLVEIQRRPATTPETDGLDLSVNAARHRAALALLGLGRLEYKRGALARVLWFVHPARALVAQREDSLHRAQIDLLYGATLRSRAGELDVRDKDHKARKAELEEAVLLLSHAHDVFASFGHSPGTIESKFDLAMAHSNAGRHELAEALFKELQASGHPLVTSHALARRSRIARGRNAKDAALRFADEAIQVAENEGAGRRDLGLAEIEGRLARAEALLMQPASPGPARRELELALLLHRGGAIREQAVARNPRVEAICLLLYASSWLQEGNVADAQRAFDEATSLMAGIENTNVHRLAEQVKATLEGSRTHNDLVIRAVSGGCLDYHSHEADLRRYLMSLAKQTHSARRDIARTLGVSPATIAAWEQEFQARR